MNSHRPYSDPPHLLGESRKTKLTLKQIRKLRKMNDVRNYEKVNYLKKVHQQYGPKAEGASPTV